ncbi:MAG TPA: LON peptidase substrate-binding domain-containing protein [Rhodoblastus sp.]|nr:LON peptidase substrate-binding domain-containing protein [Rhodoblastus sp.]
MNRPYLDISELPAELPIFPLAGCLLLPRGELPLNIFEPRYLAMIDATLAGKRLIGMIQPRPDAASDRNPALCAVGCAGKITRFAETGDGRYVIALEGVCRFHVVQETTRDTPFRLFDVSYQGFARDLQGPDSERVDRDAVLNALRAFAERNSISVDWESVAKASDEELVNSLSMMSPFGIKEKQALLEADNLRARGEVLVAIAEMELAGDGAGRPSLH